MLMLSLMYVHCRPQSSDSHPGGYHSTLLQYLSGIQQELPPERRPSPQQQQELAQFLLTQQEEQRQQNLRPEQNRAGNQQIQRQQQPSRQQQQFQQQGRQQQSLRPAPVVPVRSRPAQFRRRPGGAIIFPGPAS